jgi:hypothetical protein
MCIMRPTAKQKANWLCKNAHLIRREYTDRMTEIGAMKLRMCVCVCVCVCVCIYIYTHIYILRSQ